MIFTGKDMNIYLGNSRYSKKNGRLLFNNESGRLNMLFNKNKKIFAISGDFESVIDKNIIEIKTMISIANITIPIFMHV